ncbi:integrin alpha-L-like [Rana temporaria]|uniref:integrin alpha-L-like n=1 Tax=Rana temporaria TaxID=8407 RepID=UPI001AAC4ECC|nr:integrin alpha-L-like [Rana temporaria]
MVPVGWCCTLLAVLVQVNVFLAYNVDVSPEKIFSVNGSRFFGYRVRQIRSTDGERILVGDPDLGRLHSCDVIRGTCDIISLPSQKTTNHIGLTLEVEPKSGLCIVCGSDTPHECDQTMYMNGACYSMDSSLTPSPKITPGYQECQKADVDLCFLFDGSSSSGEPELQSIRFFLNDAIKNLRNTTVHLAIVQFSGRFKTELDFNQYQTFNNLTQVIRNLTLLRGRTFTFSAINYTLDNIYTEKAGHRPKAKKVLLMLTDGEANDEKSDIIDKADRMGVKRYLIGVGNNFNTSDLAKEQMNELPSEPNDLHTRMLKNFKELENLFAELQQKILAIEGVQTCAAASGGVCNGSAQGTSFSRELSSAGLSAALTQERQILGDPGIFDWAGGILDISEPEKLIGVSFQEEDKYGYLGYSVEVLRVSEGTFYVAGAPRHQYVGIVTVFRETPDGTEWIRNISGEQVGSYFGAEIEVGDIDQDGLSDVVLIAAPHFSDVRRSGQVSVYQYIQGSLEFRGSLHGESGHLHSQFGAAVSSLGDLDGDGFGDVAVGAPYEMEGRGALYIFGGGAGGVNSEYRQRLTAPARSSGFGLSVDGVMDMTGDGLTDLAVGAAGSVALFRSQPLLNVSVTLTSIPPEIPIPTMEGASCGIEVLLQICVEPRILTTQYTGPLNVSLQYTVILDFGRSVSRMSFANSQKEIKKTIMLEVEQPVCRNHNISLLDCFLEDSSPVLVSVTASQIPDVSRWLLSPSSSLKDRAQIPFQLCGSGGSCEPDFHLLLSMESLVVEEGASFSVFLKLHNKGENAQRVNLHVNYPTGLSFRKMNITEASRRISLLCEDLETQSLSCNISHPIMRRASWADIHIMFGIVSNVSWADRVRLSFQVTSENDGNETSMRNKVTRDLPVLYPINIISRRVENSTKYLRFIKKEDQSDVTHAYQIQNLGSSLVDTEFGVTVRTPVKETDDLVWDYHVTRWVSSGSCEEPDLSQTPEGTTKLPGDQMFLCRVEQHGTINIQVTGTLRARHPWKAMKSVNLSTEVMIGYNETRYHSQLGRKFHHVQVMTQVDLVVPPNHTLFIAGGTVGGVLLLVVLCLLLYKCGFFKRNRLQMTEDSSYTAVQQTMPSDEGATKGHKGPQEPLTSLPEPADLLPESSEGL